MATYYPLLASDYVGIQDRRKDLDSMRRELNGIINGELELCR